MLGKVTSECTKGFCFCEVHETCQSLFIHISQVQGGRCLHTGDRITLDIIPNPSRPGQQMAGNVKFIGRAADVSGVSHV